MFQGRPISSVRQPDCESEGFLSHNSHISPCEYSIVICTAHQVKLCTADHTLILVADDWVQNNSSFVKWEVDKVCQTLHRQKAFKRGPLQMVIHVASDKHMISAVSQHQHIQVVCHEVQGSRALYMVHISSACHPPLPTGRTSIPSQAVSPRRVFRSPLLPERKRRRLHQVSQAGLFGHSCYIRLFFEM